jgi:hypothetical protein
MNDYSVFLVAGIATTPSFFADLRAELDQLYKKSGAKVDIGILFPYGDFRMNRIRQINMIRMDLRHSFSNVQRCIGGRQARDMIRESFNGGGIVIIGHSGGGVSGYDAGRMLQQMGGFPIHQMIQIGSPKVRISAEFREQVVYLRAQKQSKAVDLITQLGSWGGIDYSRRTLIPYWNSRKYAPLYIENIELLGGHADYFRRADPYVDRNGKSNLSKTVKELWKWIQPR